MHDGILYGCGGPACMQNPCRRHYEIAADETPHRRLAVVFTELVKII